MYRSDRHLMMHVQSIVTHHYIEITVEKNLKLSMVAATLIMGLRNKINP